MSEPLSSRQEAFARHFCATGNAAESARLAGYAAGSARQTGHRLLQEPWVIGRVRAIRAHWRQTARDEAAILLLRLEEAWDAAVAAHSAPQMLQVIRLQAEIAGMVRKGAAARADLWETPGAGAAGGRAPMARAVHHGRLRAERARSAHKRRVRALPNHALTEAEVIHSATQLVDLHLAAEDRRALLQGLAAQKQAGGQAGTGGVPATGALTDHDNSLHPETPDADGRHDLADDHTDDAGIDASEAGFLFVQEANRQEREDEKLLREAGYAVTA